MYRPQNHRATRGIIFVEQDQVSPVRIVESSIQVDQESVGFSAAGRAVIVHSDSMPRQQSMRDHSSAIGGKLCIKNALEVLANELKGHRRSDCRGLCSL